MDRFSAKILKITWIDFLFRIKKEAASMNMNMEAIWKDFLLRK
jgi:hypothetical protein